MKRRICFVLICFFCSYVAFGQNTGQKQYKLSKKAIAMENALTFLVVGDWGRNGHFNQRDVGDRMNEAVDILDADFIISTGDNFYKDGIASVDDPYWISSFESIYDGAYMFLPWYPVLGNHDYRGNVQAQIDYSHRSRRWHMPDRYHAFNKTAKDGTVATFVFIDTNPFEDKYYEERYKEAVVGQDTTRQLVWMDSVFTAAVNSDWIVVIGHHPIYSGGRRVKGTEDIKNKLEPLFNKHKVDVYFAGHEHDLQHIKTKNHTHQFISGAGSQVRETGKGEYSLFAKGTPGFMSAAITKEKMLVQVIDHQGKILYTTEVANRKP